MWGGRSIMKNMRNTIERLQEIEQSIADLKAEKEALCESDTNITPEGLQTAYKELFGDYKKPELTKIFIFAFLYIFDRERMFRNMTPKIRREIATMLHLKCENLVSMRKKDTIVSYLTYPDFAKAVETLIQKAESPETAPKRKIK